MADVGGVTRVLRVAFRKTFRNHVNEARGGSSAAKLFDLKISWCGTCNRAWLLNTAAQLCQRNSNRNELRLQNGDGRITDKIEPIVLACSKSIAYKLSRDFSFSSFPGAKKTQT